MNFFIRNFTHNSQRWLLARNPCVCVAVAFMAGIVVQRYTSIAWSSQVFLAILVASSVVAILFAKLFLRWQIAMLGLWFLVAGYCNASLKNQHFGELPQNEIVRAKIVSNLEEKPKSYKATVEILDEEKPCNALIYIKKDSLARQLQYGDVILFQNRFQRVENRENTTFDYKGFLANKYIYSQSYVGSWKFVEHQTNVFSVCMQLRNAALTKLALLGLSLENLQLIAALAFGDKSLLDEETKGNFSAAGAMHILAVSGLHVGIINGILFFLFSFIRSQKLQIVKIIGCVSGIWAYACLTGMSPSVQRAAIMCSMISISLLLRRHVCTYNSLAVAAFFSLLISPNDLFSVSFQLSYLAVLSIVYFGTKIQNLVRSETVIGKYVWGIVAVSVAVQIGTMPLTLYYFGTLPIYNLITNVLVIPLSFVILLLVICTLVMCWLPFVASGFVMVLNFVTSYLQNSIATICSFPHAQIQHQIPFYESVLFYIIIVVAIFAMEYIRQLRFQKNLFRL